MKRRSSTNKPQPEPIFFVDRNLGRQIVGLLRDGGLKVIAHDDHFAQNTPDVEWIPVVAKKGWIALTNDKNIARNRLEIDAHMTANGRAYVPKGKMRPSEFGALLVRSKERVFRDLKKKHKTGGEPFIAKIKPDLKSPDGPGHVEKWMDVKKWCEKIKKRKK